MRRTAMHATVLASCILLAGCIQAGTPPDDVQADRPATAAPGETLRLPTLLTAPPATSRVTTGGEPSILTDRGGQYVWMADTSGGHFSTDNGTTWQKMPRVSLAKVAFNDGWGLAQDDAGNLYAAELSDNHIDVGRSGNGGRSWDSIGHFAAASVIADRPWLAARGDGEVVLFYYDYPGVGFPEHCARSTDGGATFLDRHPTGGRPQGGKAFFDSQGRFYYSQSGGDLYRFSTTCAAGAERLQMIQGAGHNVMIQADVEGTDIYMAAATESSRSITLAGTKDFRTVKRIVVSPPDLQTNTFATVSVHDGVVAVAWYGSTAAGVPSSGFQGDWHVYLAIVHDFWTDPVVHHLQVTQSPNHRGTICMGGVTCTSGRELLDYFMVDHDIWGGIHIAYVDDVTAARGSYHVHIPPEDVPGAPPLPERPPTASFIARTEGHTVHADASFSQAAAGHNITRYAWDWGDGASSDGVTARHTYADFGVYKITLTVRDSQGLEGKLAKGVVVEGKDPEEPPDPEPQPEPEPQPRPTPGPTETLDAPPVDRTDPQRTTPVPWSYAVLVLAGLLLRRR